MSLQSLMIKESIKRYGLGLLIAVALVAAVLVSVKRYILTDRKATPTEGSKTGSTSKIIQEPEVKKAVSPLDGTLVPETHANRHPLAVVIENHPDARPQSGLSAASLVYEAITEGGITRFLAIFGPAGSDRIGPVRSARSYFLDWVAEYDAFFAHVGGALDALKTIPTLGIKDLDQFSLGTKAYLRDANRLIATEHTVYTSTDKLWQAAEDKGYDTKTIKIDSHEFKDDPAVNDRPQSQTVTVKFSSTDYDVSWTYDRASNTYKRSLAGKAHLDANTNSQLTAKNIIVQEVVRSKPDDQDSFIMKTIGTGPARIFRDGQEVKGTWKKTSTRTRTFFFDEAGNRIKFNRGPTWIQIVPPGTAVVVETSTVQPSVTSSPSGR